MPRQTISSGTVWEGTVGYSRAVRIGNWIAVAGTTAADENTQPVGVGDPYAQTIYVLRKIERALQQAGAELTNVIRTRIFITDLAHWPEIARGHGEIFHAIRPAATMVVVKALINPNYLVEIEADAVLEE